MSLVLDGLLGITFPSGSTQNNAVANTAAINSLLGANGLAASSEPSGSVIQTVNFITNSTTSSFNQTLTATSLAATITPKFSTSSILIFYAANIYIGSTNAWAISTIYRNSTNLSGSSIVGFGSSGTGVGSSSTGQQSVHSASYYDSPATTSSVTYTIYIAGTSGITTTINGAPAWIGNPYSSITLMEIR